MSLASHLDRLREKHHDLERKVETEQRRPSADDLRIAELKRQKLILKDEIARLSHA